MSNNLPVIVTDLDGVLVNLMDEVIIKIYEAFGIKLTPEDCVEYAVHNSFFPHLAQHFHQVQALDQFLIRNCWTNSAMLAQARPYWNMWHALHDFQDLGGTLICLTGRGPTGPIKTATLDWLLKWGFPNVECLFTQESPGNQGMSEPELKREDVNLIACNHPNSEIWFVEDQPATAAKLVKTAIPNVVVYLVQRPWTEKVPKRDVVNGHCIIHDIKNLVGGASTESRNG